jgi:hypothetical protein
MFLRKSLGGYTKSGEQWGSGLFLILMEEEGATTGPAGQITIRAMVRHVHLHQLGQFMMGTLRVFVSHRKVVEVPLSGSYGGDGLLRTVPSEVFALGTPLPQELYDAWNKGGGHNSSGSEEPLMQEWARKNLKQLRRSYKDG